MTDKCLTEKDLTEKLMIEEYKVLRQEHENNRKFIFERPLILLVGALAAVANFKEPSSPALNVLPLIFLAGLWFNLWFTCGRMNSSSRIVAYIQVVFEGKGEVKWVGWESALSAHRQWQYKVKTKIESEPKIPSDHIDGNGMYENVFYFHLISGILFSLVSLSRGELMKRICGGVSTNADWIWLLFPVVSLIVFLIIALQFRPSTVRHEIRRHRAIWLKVLPNVAQLHAYEFAENSG